MDNFPPTWAPAIHAYLLEVESRSSPNNKRFRESRLKAICRWAGSKGIELADYKKQDLQQFLIDRGKEGISENTRYHDYQTLKMFCSFCQENGFRTDNPFVKFKIKPPAEVHVPQPSVEDLRALLCAIRDRNNPRINDDARTQSPEVCRYLMARETAIIMTLVDSGARVGEILGLKMDDFHPDKGQLVLRKTKGKKIGYVPVTEPCINAINAYLALRPSQVKSPYLFLSLLGDQLDGASYGKVFARYVKFAKIQKFTLHGLRHYTLSRVAEADFWGAVALARHKDARTTQRYAQHVPEHVKSAHAQANPLGQVLGVTGEETKTKRKRMRLK